MYGMDPTGNRSSWFAPGLRTKTAPELVDLLELDLRNAQKAVYDESGEDVRLKCETGSRWSSLREKRKWFARECQEKMEEYFDKLYEHFADKKRVSQDWYMYVMPTMKTPAFQRHRSRVEQAEEVADNVVVPVPPKPLSVDQVSKPTTPNSGDTTEPTGPGMVDVTNTAVRRSTCSHAKKRSVPNKENTHESLPAIPATTNPKRTTRACTRKPATTARKTTRARTRKAERDSGGQGREDSCIRHDDTSLVDAVATSSRRMTRSRIKSAAAVASQTAGEKERPDPVLASKPPPACQDPQNGVSPMPVSPQSAESDHNQAMVECSSPGMIQSKQKEPDDVPELVSSPTQIEEPTGEGVSQNSSSSKTLDLVTVENPRVSSPAIETSTHLMEPEETITANQTSLPVPIVSDVVAPPVRRSTRLNKRAPGTPETSCTSDTDDEPYIRPPPPKRSLLKLKKKGKQGGRKGKRIPRKVDEDAVKTDAQYPSSGESTVAVGESTDRNRSQDKNLANSGEENCSTSDAVTQQPQQSVEDVPTGKRLADISVRAVDEIVQSDTQSSETTYESCVSEVEGGTSSKSDAKASRRIPRRAAKAAKVRGRVKTPVGGRTQPEEHSPAAGTRTPKQPHTPRTPGTYTRPRPGLSPMSVPYLSNTPRVLQQLHEEHQVRSGGKIISLAELRSRNSPAPCHSSKKCGTPRLPRAPQVGCVKATVVKAKRLRSVSMERLPEAAEAKRPSRGGAQCQASPLEKTCPDATPSSKETETTESDDSQEKDSTQYTDSDAAQCIYSSDTAQGNPKDSEDTTQSADSDVAQYSSDTAEGGQKDNGDTPPQAKSGQPKSASKMGYIWNLFGKKAETLNLTAAGGATEPPMSFLPRNSPRKQELFKARQQKLVEKVQRKKEDEERRKRELEVKRQQELQDKIKRREERAKRVAEKQAVLAREEQEKRMRLEGQRQKDELSKKEKAHQRKAKEFEQKTKKQKERMQAAEARRRQEEEQKMLRLHQLEEERRMHEELTKKRMEQEEEEKRARRVERQKAEQERQLQREVEREAEQRRRIQEERLQAKEAAHLQEELEAKRQQETVRKQQEHLRKEEEKKKFEKLLGGHAQPATNPVQSGNTANSFIEQWKQLRANGIATTGTVTKSKKPPSKKHENSVSTEEPEDGNLMNSTFTIETIDTKQNTASASVVTPAPSLHNQSKYTVVSSYEMTPLQQQDPFSVYENYDIGDLGSDDSTDEEDCPKKTIPPWAHPTELGKLMHSQEKKVNSRAISIRKIFPPGELLLAPDLARIFKHKRKRFYQRSSSARWDSPMMKKSRAV